MSRKNYTPLCGASFMILCFRLELKFSIVGTDLRVCPSPEGEHTQARSSLHPALSRIGPEGGQVRPYKGGWDRTKSIFLIDIPNSLL